MSVASSDAAVSGLRNWVAGEPWRPQDPGAVPVDNPATEERLAEVPDAGRSGVDAAVRAADAAFPSWAALTPAARGDALLALADAIDARREDFALLETLQVGKPLDVSRYEIGRAAQTYRFYAGAGRTLGAPAAGEYKSSSITSFVRREPIGVVAALAAWNYPMALTAWRVGPALAAGNTVVLKPSPAAPLTAMLLGEVAATVLPGGVLNVITGERGTGEALVAHPDVGLVSLTGGTETGKAVMAAAARGVKGVHLELGGKAPVVVFDDADLDRLRKVLRAGAYWNGGQDCTAASRVYVSERRRLEVTDALADAAATLVPRDPLEHPDAELGPLVSVAHRDRVRGFVDRAVGAGADVVAGGAAGRDRGAYFQPTVIAGAKQESELVQDEIFGPVVAVVTYDDEREAVAMANDVRFGLAASVWTRDLDRAMRVAKRVRAGTVWINDHGPTTAEMPFGGFKQSGLGRDLSVHSVEDHTELKHVAISVDEAGWRAANA